MQHVTCEQCHERQPRGETFAVLGQTLCQPCALALLESDPNRQFDEEDMTQLVDPTVCGWCAADHGAIELPAVAGVPTCMPCDEQLRHRPFPAWIKASCAGILVLVIVTWVLNLRFFNAFVAAARGERAAIRGDLDGAAALFERAYEQAPEAHHHRFEAALFRGLQLLQQDRMREALSHLAVCREILPADARIIELCLTAEIGAAFDEGQYETMLAKAEELLEHAPSEPMAASHAASAHACMFAKTGDEQHEHKTLEFLNQIPEESLDPQDDFVDRIHHRLASREIISRDNFKQRFPNGWKRGEP